MKTMCIGFYGYGNAGDEAVARSFDRYLSAPFDNSRILFSTEMSNEGIDRVMASSEFYRDRGLCSVYDVHAVMDQDVMIVGGGNLSAVYGSSQVLKARLSGRTKMIARIGTSVHDDYLKGEEKSTKMVQSSLGLFDYISVRDKASADILGALHIDCKVGSDMAIDLPPDRNGELPKKPYFLVVVREVDQGDIPRQLAIAKATIDAVRRETDNVYLLPFCHQDEVFSDKVSAENGGVPILRGVWTNPHKLVWVIANSEYVVSVGRLHAAIFAIGNRRPCFAITYPWLAGYDKINAFMWSCGLGNRVADWGKPPAEIAAAVHEAVFHRANDQEHINIYSGHLKGLLLESLCPVWDAMEVDYGLGLERGMKKGEFRLDDYDDSYYFGARAFKLHGKMTVYHPSRGNWEGWDTVKDLIVTTMNPSSVFDAGCARGWFMKRFVDAKIPCTGVDMSQAAWENCAPGMQPYIKVGTFDDNNHVTHRTDVVTCFDVMEHIYEPDVGPAIQALKKIAGKYIVLNICAPTDREQAHTIEKGKPIPVEMEWLAVSGHVTIRHRAWWKAVLEDPDWEVDEAMLDRWFKDPRFNFGSWQRHNVLILKRRGAK
jgi:polysaccharide pyruvyl transferase WcaK-like protein